MTTTSMDINKDREIRFLICFTGRNDVEVETFELVETVLGVLRSIGLRFPNETVFESWR